VKSPTGYLAIANRQAELMIRISSEFGFTQVAAGYRHRRQTNFRFWISPWMITSKKALRILGLK
jgi:hypothetical protein